jgi:hypothetical protein
MCHSVPFWVIFTLFYSYLLAQTKYGERVKGEFDQRLRGSSLCPIFLITWLVEL